MVVKFNRDKLPVVEIQDDSAHATFSGTGCLLGETPRVGEVSNWKYSLLSAQDKGLRADGLFYYIDSEKAEIVHNLGENELI